MNDNSTKETRTSVNARIPHIAYTDINREEFEQNTILHGSIKIDKKRNNLIFKESNISGDEINVDMNAATEENAGVMSADDKINLNNSTVIQINWTNRSSLNDELFLKYGVYNIKGERNPEIDDNLPILNRGGGHTFNARLTVLDSSISGDGKDDDKCITQVLSFSNRLGQGEVYIRTGKGSSLNNLTWEKWSTLQRNVNVGEVTSLDHLIDNGIYSGVLTPTGETFVLVVINNYAFASQHGTQKCISQFKYSVNPFGVVFFGKRVKIGNTNFPAEWDILNKNEIDRMLNNAVEQVIATIVDDAPETFDTLKEIADWIANDETGAVALANATKANAAAITAERTRAIGQEGLLNNAIAGEKSRAEQAEKAINDKLDDEIERSVAAEGEINQNTIAADSMSYSTTTDDVSLEFETLDGKSGSVTFPAATTEKAGVMSAKDKKLIGNLSEEEKDAFYIIDAKNNVVATVSKDGINSTKFSSKNFREIIDGGKHFCIADENGNVIFRVGEKYGVHDIVGDYIMAQYNTKQVCWIDDDFAILNNSSGEILEQYQLVHDWCLSNEVRLDFAFIPQEYSNEQDTSKRMEILKMWEDEGFRFLMHPIHRGWYDYSDNIHDIEKVKVGIVKCQRFFKINNILSDAKILVYPGGSNAYPENVNIIRKYVDCAITATDSETNEGVKNNRYQIKRYALSLSADKPKTIVKKELKEYIDRGDWVILYTHLYSFSTEDIVDETSNTIANVLDIVDYVNTLCSLRPTEEIWRDRKFMFNYFKK